MTIHYKGKYNGEEFLGIMESNDHKTMVLAFAGKQLLPMTAQNGTIVFGETFFHDHFDFADLSAFGLVKEQDLLNKIASLQEELSKYKANVLDEHIKQHIEFGNEQSPPPPVGPPVHFNGPMTVSSIPF